MNALMGTLNRLGAAWTDYAGAMAWQVALVILIIALLAVALRRAPAAWRHALWLLVFAKLLLPPTLSAPWTPTGWFDTPQATLTAPAHEPLLTTIANEAPTGSAPLPLPPSEPRTATEPEPDQVEIEMWIMKNGKPELGLPWSMPDANGTTLTEAEFDALRKSFKDDPLDRMELLSAPRIITRSTPTSRPRINVGTKLPYVRSASLDHEGNLQIDHAWFDVGIDATLANDERGGNHDGLRGLGLVLVRGPLPEHLGGGPSDTIAHLSGRGLPADTGRPLLYEPSAQSTLTPALRVW